MSHETRRVFGNRCLIPAIAFCLCLIILPVPGTAATQDSEEAAVRAIRALGVDISVNRERVSGRVYDVTLLNADDRVFESIAMFKGLRKLAIRNSPKLKGNGFGLLADLKYLDLLYISGSPLSKEGVKEIFTLKGLSLLYLHKTSVTGSDLAGIHSLSQLELLDLSGNRRLNSGSFGQLKELKALVQLCLCSLDFRDADMQAIWMLPALKELVLSETKVTDLAIPYFIAMPQAQQLSLHLEETEISESGAQYLMKRLPKAHIVY